MIFKPPTVAERIRAIGDTSDLPKVLRRALEPGEDFEPISTPKPGDWLAEHHETGQSFDDFVRSKPNRPDKKRSKIYLQPLGEFGFPQSGVPPNGKIPLVQTLKEFAEAYFSMPVDVLRCLSLSEHNITTRINQLTQKQQILAGDILAILQKNIPRSVAGATADAFCVFAITMEDLYPEPSWNFVFGQATLGERVGVYSFARYDPAFYGQQQGEDYKGPRSAGIQKLILRRSCKILAHETGHMFGLTHCIYFDCVLNGSNHLAESDARPAYLCPVCLRKLQHSIGFDVTSRYGNLFSFYKKVGFDDEAQWVTKRLKWILPAEAAKAM